VHELDRDPDLSAQQRAPSVTAGIQNDIQPRDQHPRRSGSTTVKGAGANTPSASTVPSDTNHDLVRYSRQYWLIRTAALQSVNASGECQVVHTVGYARIDRQSLISNWIRQTDVDNINIGTE